MGLDWFDIKEQGENGKRQFPDIQICASPKFASEAESCPCKWILVEICVRKIWNTTYFPYANHPGKQPLVLTYNKKNLHGNVTDCRAPSGGQVIIANKAHVVRYGHGNIKRRQKNKPVPASFKSAKMQKYEFGLFCIRDFILRKCWFIYKNILWIKTKRREGRHNVRNRDHTALNSLL